MRQLSAITILLALLLFPVSAKAAGQPDFDLRKALALKVEARAFEKAENHTAAARAYENAVSFGLSAEYGLNQAIGNYVAAEDHTAAVAAMEKLAALGHAGYAHFETGDFFEPLRSHPDFPATLEQLKENAALADKTGGQPDQILNFGDAERFFEALERAESASTHEKPAIYYRHYFAKASPAMVDYVSMKINSIKAFTDHVEENRLYYEGLRKSLNQLQQLAPSAVSALERLRSLAGADNLPRVHFIVGQHTSAGTASANGLLLGLDFITSDRTHTKKLPSWTAPFISTPNDSLWVILHEYVHFLQVTGQRTVLGNALVEGSADFLANLVFGPRAVPMPYTVFGKANRPLVVERFMTEKDITDYSDWTGNNSVEYADDWVADLGYFVGEEIARGFYENRPDKEEAIRMLLELREPSEILRISGFPND